MEPNLVSVGMPVYNRPESLRRALDCIINQTYKNLEIIVSNDCSPSKKVYTILNYYAKKDPRIKLFVQCKNIGCCANIQFTLRQATGKYFMYAQEDDTWDTDYIGRMVSQLEKNPDQVVAISAVRRVDEDGNLFDITRFTTDTGVVPAHTIHTTTLVLNAMKDERLSFLFMGLFRRDILIQFDNTYSTTGIDGKDDVIMAEMLLIHPYGYVDQPMYTKGLEHDKIKKIFKHDNLCFIKLYARLIKVLILSKRIPIKNKVIIPAAIITNLLWMLRANAAQIVFMLPKDHWLRKMIRKMGI